MTLPTRMPRLLAVLLVALLCCLPGLAVEPDPAAAAQREPALTLGSVTPKAPTAEDTIRVTGAVENPADQPLVGVDVRLRIQRTPLSSRDMVAGFASAGDEPAGTPIYGREAEVGRVQSGQRDEFTLKLPADELGLASFGVYGVAVEAVAADGTTVAVQRTFLVYTPDKKSIPEPTRVGWMLPLVDRPHQQLGQTFADEKLAAAMAPGGRLDRLTRAGAAAKEAQVPVTWAIDPALLDAANNMTDGYRVRTGGERVAGTGRAQATEFLTRLKAATQGGSVLSLPYADVDTAALTRHGLTEDVTTAISQGEDMTSEILGVTPQTELAWPPGGRVNQKALDSLAANRKRTVILEDNALPLSEPLYYTPDPVATTRTSSGSVKVLLADNRLTEITGSATDGQGSATLTEQRFLAETALVTAERPNASRGLVVAPPRDWNPPGTLASDLITDTAQVPWLEPTSLDELREKDPPEELTRRGLTYGGKARRAELNRSHLTDVRDLRTSLDRFSSIFNPLPNRIEEFNLAILRTESASWRGRRKQGRALLDVVAGALASQRSQVRILRSNRRLSLAGDRASVPLTIENGLSDPVTVRLRVRSANSRRMDVGELPETIEIGPHAKEQVRVPIRAASTGVVELNTRLLTPEGKTYGEPVTFTVRSTVYGTVAVIITASALVVLFAGAGYRVVRRLSRARRHKLHHADEAPG